MTFLEYIASRRVTDTPRGDFIDDTQTLIRLEKLPNVRSWGELHGFMFKRGACIEAIDEGRKVWRQYSKSLTLEDILS